MNNIPLIKLCEDSVLLANKFNGNLFTLEHNREEEVVELHSDDYIVEVFKENDTALLLGDNICSIDGNKYYMYTKVKYEPK